MFFRFVIALLPLAAWAQTPAAEPPVAPPPAGAAAVTPGAPAEVDQALRARVSQFLQYHVDGEFRKAYNLVAEDTQEEYFNSAKLRLKTFEITDVKYLDDFRKAEVNATVTMAWNVELQENVSIVPMITTWKIENGKWVWYHTLKTGDALTPMGPSRVDPAVNGHTVTKIPEHIDSAAVASAAQGIVKQLSLDKRLVKLSVDQPSTDQVIVHNGTPGYVGLSLASVPEIAGFSAKLDKANLGPNQDAVVRFAYDPASHEPRKPFQVRVVADPFNQIFTVNVLLGEAPGDN